MMDAAKAADLVLLMIDGSFGLEMETFEFLNLLQVCLGVCVGGVGGVF
jgi:ribosome biogenesis protein BMS1